MSCTLINNGYPPPLNIYYHSTVIKDKPLIARKEYTLQN